MTAESAPAREPAAVVVIGSYLVALVIEVERFPAVGETVNGGGYFETHGGKGSNMAVQAARLGARCAFVGRVGDDARGRSFRAMLTGEGWAPITCTCSRASPPASASYCSAPAATT